MSAIRMRCRRCGGVFLAGVVGMTPWPAHVCPDGTKDAPGEPAPERDPWDDDSYYGGGPEKR